jgi:hypothetical protein
MSFRKLDEIAPPQALAGDTALVDEYGKWVKADVVSVDFRRHKDGRRYVWRWEYGVRINGVYVVRYDTSLKPVK